jgi:hypothetical protein
VEVSLNRIPIAGWKRCVHEAASFESAGEYAAAALLDDSRSVVWWLRNDPANLRIPSPAGFFEPDFVYLFNKNKKPCMGILEIKSDIFWDGEGSLARIKADAAREWLKTVNQAGPAMQWQFEVVLDQDALAAASFEAMREVALLRFPDGDTGTGS